MFNATTKLYKARHMAYASGSLTELTESEKELLCLSSFLLSQKSPEDILNIVTSGTYTLTNNTITPYVYWIKGALTEVNIDVTTCINRAFYVFNESFGVVMVKKNGVNVVSIDTMIPYLICIDNSGNVIYKDNINSFGYVGELSIKESFGDEITTSMLKKVVREKVVEVSFDLYGLHEAAECQDIMILMGIFPSHNLYIVEIPESLERMSSIYRILDLNNVKKSKEVVANNQSMTRYVISKNCELTEDFLQIL